MLQVQIVDVPTPQKPSRRSFKDLKAGEIVAVVILSIFTIIGGLASWSLSIYFRIEDAFFSTLIFGGIAMAINAAIAVTSIILDFVLFKIRILLSISIASGISSFVVWVVCLSAGESNYYYWD